MCLDKDNDETGHLLIRSGQHIKALGFNTGETFLVATNGMEHKIAKLLAEDPERGIQIISSKTAFEEIYPTPPQIPFEFTLHRPAHFDFSIPYEDEHTQKIGTRRTPTNTELKKKRKKNKQASKARKRNKK